MKKRLTALFMALCVMLSLVPMNTFAAASDGSTVLAFSSDVHNGSDNKAADRLDGWIDDVETKVNGSIDFMGFCGDMANANTSGDTYWNYAKKVFDVVEKHGIEAAYTTGNHEQENGNFSSTTNSLKSKFTVNGEAKVGSDYRIYCIGAESTTNNNYSTSQVDKLSTYLNGLNDDKTVIILTHFPLHTHSSRTTTNADKMIDALNTAVDNGKNILFLWGHNHSMSPKDGNYDQIFKPGSSITYKSGSTKTLKFAYAAAGAMSDSEYTGSGNIQGKGLVVKYTDNEKLNLTYYKADGSVLLSETVDFTAEGGNQGGNEGGNQGGSSTGTATTPVAGKKYVIVATTNGKKYALTTTPGASYSNNNGGYNYTGFAGKEYNASTTVTDDMVWEFVASGNGFNIKNGNNFLNATYVKNNSNGSDGALMLNSTKDVWTLSSNRLLSANSSKYLTHSNTSENSFVNTFSVRSENNASTLEFYEFTGSTGNQGGNQGGNEDDNQGGNQGGTTEGTLTSNASTPAAGKKYVIVATTNNTKYALTTKAGQGYQNTGSSNSQLYNYTGFEGKTFTAGMTVTDDMVFEFESANGGFYIKNGSSYLNATYVDNSSTGKDGDLMLSSTKDVWTLSSNTLQSANSAKYLAHSNGDKGFVNTFTVRSSGSTLEFYEFTGSTGNQGGNEGGNQGGNEGGNQGGTTPGGTIGNATTPVSGKTYVIVATTDTKKYAMTTAEGTKYTNNGGSNDEKFNYTGFAGKEFSTGMTVTSDMVWEFVASGNGFNIKNGNSYLAGKYVSNGTGSQGHDGSISLGTTADVWTLSSGKLQSTNASQNGRNNQAMYLTHSNKSANTFVNTFSVRSSSNASTLEFYEYTAPSQPEACQHTYGNWTVKTAATCDAAGTEVRECSKCHETESKTIPALGHNYGTEWLSDATTHWHKCSRCNEKSDMANHNMVNDKCSVCGYTAEHVHSLKHVNLVMPTCTEAGAREYYECTGCGKWFEDSSETKEITDKDSIVIAALGHDFSDYKSNNDATCEKDGTKTATCSRCGEKKTVADERSKLDHYFDTIWIGDETGHYHVCLDCKAKSEVQAHEFVIDTCKVCDYERAHVHQTTLVKAVEATCTEAGNTAYYTCIGCENWFEDAEATKVIADKASVVVAALGHSFTTYVSNNDAECEKDGTKTAKCDRCDVTDTQKDEGSALKHTYGEDRNCVYCGQKNPVKLESEIVFTEAGSSVVYTGSTIELSEEVVDATANAGKVTFTYFLDKDCTVPTFEGEQREGTAASSTGVYYVKATLEGNEDYNESTTEDTYILKVVPKKLTSMTATNMTSSIKLTWKKSAEADGYIISRRKSGTSASSYEDIAVIDDNGTLSYSDKSMKRGTRYFYTIRAFAYGEDGTRVLGNRMTTATQIVRMRVTAVKNYEEYVKVSWHKVSGVEKYEVLRKVSGKDDEYKRIKTITDGSTSYKDTSSKAVVNGRRSYYKVVAVFDTDAEVNGESYGKTNVFLNRGKISSVTAAKKAFTVKWNKNSKAEGYEIMYSTSSSFDDYETVYISSKNTTSKKISGLKAGKKYYVKVRSYKTYNNTEYPSAWSGYKSVTTKK